MAFSQAIELEGDQPGRYIAYAKALEKIGERHKAAEALETAKKIEAVEVLEVGGHECEPLVLKELRLRIRILVECDKTALVQLFQNATGMAAAAVGDIDVGSVGVGD